MNCKALTCAIFIASILPATTLLADDHSSGPTLYGKINVSLELGREGSVPDTSNGIVAGGDNVWEVLDNATRLGIKGEEDLGGLTGIYQFEFETYLTDGAGIGKNRNSFIGFKGDFGTIMAGRFDTPFKKAQGKIDLFNDSRIDIKNVLGGEEREANILGYKTLTINGVSFFGAFLPGESATDNENQPAQDLLDAFSAAVQFESEQFFLAAAYDYNVPWSFYKGQVDSVLGTDLESISRTDAYRLTGIMKMDNSGVGVMLQGAELADVATPLEQLAVVVSAYMQVEHTKFKLQFGATQHELGSTSGMDSTHVAFGADQKLSKNTTLYTAFHMRELDRGDFNLSNSEKIDTKYLLVGAMHSF